MDAGAEPTEQGKMWAAVSYGSFFIGFPLGVIPLIQRDDAFALYHAKTATAVWLVAFVVGVVMAFVYTVISFVTCGFGSILFPIILLPVPWTMVVSIHGLILALNGQTEEPMGGFGLGEMMFGQLTLKEKDQLPGPPPAPPAPPPPPVA